MNIEDVQSELEQLAKFLEDGYFDGKANELQRNLLIELTIMKMKELSKG